MRKPKIETLIAKLNVQGDTAAEKIMAQLVDVGRPAVPALICAAQDESAPRIRKWSLQALGMIGDRRAAAILILALGDPKMTIKLHSLKGLTKMKNKKAAKKIASLLEDESGGIRVNALYALMQIKDPSTKPQILKALSDPKWYVRQNACIACGQLKIEKAKRKLRELQTGDDRKAVRLAAEEALLALSAGSVGADGARSQTRIKS